MRVVELFNSSMYFSTDTRTFVNSFMWAFEILCYKNGLIINGWGVIVEDISASYVNEEWNKIHKNFEREGKLSEIKYWSAKKIYLFINQTEPK